MKIEFENLGLWDKTKFGFKILIHSPRLIFSLLGFLISSWWKKKRARRSFEKTLKEYDLPSNFAKEIANDYEPSLRDFMRRGDGRSR